MRLDISDWMGEKVNLGGGLGVPPKLEFRWVQDGAPDDIGGDVWVEAELEGGRYRVTRLAVQGLGITTALLRRISLQELLREAVHASAVLVTKTPQGLATSEVAFPLDVAKHGPTPEALKAVAVIYRLAYATSEAPKKAVVETLGLAGSTAGRWVMQARAAGYLGPTKPGRPGA